MASMARSSNEPMILRVAQREIPLVVSRNSRARRITLRLDGLSGDVRLVLPKRMALREGLDFATQKADWLVAQLDARPARVPFTDGAVIPLRGRDHVIRHVAGARRGVDLGAHLRRLDQALVVEMTTLLGQHLVLDLSRRGARLLSLRPGPGQG